MDISNLAPELGKLLGLQPSTLVLLIMIITTAANAGARLIPSTATGFLGGVRKVCAFVGIHIANRVAPGTTVTDIAKAALLTPAVNQKVEAVSGSSASDAAASVRASLPTPAQPDARYP